MNMVKKSSPQFSCPGCERTNFRSLVGVRNHFIIKRHSFQCHICERIFHDELAIIQHYQKYTKSSSPGIPKDVQRALSPGIPSPNIPTPSVPSPSVPSPSVPSPSVPSPSVLSPSVPSSTALVTPAVRSIAVQTDAPEEPSKLSEQKPKITDGHLSDTLLASMTAITFKNGSLLESLPCVTPSTPVYPADIHPLEQNLILRYLRSRCHSWNRLQAEGYILGPASIRNKKHPSKGSIPTYHFRETPRSELQADGTVRAIAIDCEMVGVRNGRQTLAFLSAIDFLTGDVLISRYVNPSEEVVDWRYKFSGVTQAIMASAVASGAAFKSWREARDALWDFMDDSTVLVGHSLHFDLEVLGISHAKVVDSAILTSETVYPSIPSTKPLTRQWGLKRLAKDLLDLDIQAGNCGHNALEDAYAARDVVIWCIRNPEDLKVWAVNAQLQEEQRLAQNRQRNGKGRSKGKFPATQSTQKWGHNTGFYESSEEIRWSDFAEELGWPDGYDPWSD